MFSFIHNLALWKAMLVRVFLAKCSVWCAYTRTVPVDSIDQGDEFALKKVYCKTEQKLSIEALAVYVRMSNLYNERIRDLKESKNYLVLTVGINVTTSNRIKFMV
jgi:hypothetical protein